MIKNICIYFIIILDYLFVYLLIQWWEKWQGRGERKGGDGGTIWSSEWNIKYIISICSTVIIYDLWKLYVLKHFK